jgi:hypothetical protein
MEASRKCWKAYGAPATAGLASELAATRRRHTMQNVCDPAMENADVAVWVNGPLNCQALSNSKRACKRNSYR